MRAARLLLGGALALSALFAFGCGDDEPAAPSSSATSGGGGSGQGGSAAGNGGAGSGAGATGGEGGAPPAYQPDPIPDVGPEPPSCDEPVKDGLQFLDDTCMAKRYPSFEDRSLACPTIDDSATIELAEGGSVVYQPSRAVIEVDGGALAGIVPDELAVTVILVRRVGGVPHYRYLSNGNHDVTFQPWSSTKFLAATNAAARLRIVSDGAVGLSASVDGIALGDLVSSMHAYDWDPYSSNSLGRYFHNVGGRERANAMIHDAWLQRPAAETFGGNYGEQAPPLGYDFEEPGGETVSVNPDSTTGPANHLSSFTLAEALKRIVLFREEPAQRLEGLAWKDVEALLYGAEGSEKYGAWGGMSLDKAVYLQSGHDMDYLEERSRGRWRIFSKLGNGSDGQLVNVAYGCFPVLDPDDEPVPGWGRELVIGAQLAGVTATWAERDRLLATAFRAILVRVVDGRL
jgi:hypothetical protein